MRADCGRAALRRARDRPWLSRLVLVLLVLAAPGSDALDDEEPLAGLHIAETAGLAGDGLGRVHLTETTLEPELLGPEPLNLGGALGEGVLGGHVAPEGLRVEERDECDDGDRQP